MRGEALRGEIGRLAVLPHAPKAPLQRPCHGSHVLTAQHVLQPRQARGGRALAQQAQLCVQAGACVCG
jgi:hypothetical protein